MKRILFISFCFVSFFLKGYAQVPGVTPTVVTDPTNLVQIKELVKTGTEQTDKISKQVDFLKQQKENLEMINSSLKRAQTVEKAITQSQETIKNLNLITNQLGTMSNLSPSYLAQLTKSMGQYYNQLTATVGEITSCLTDGKYKMSDAERLQYINEQLGQIQYINRVITRNYKEAARINNMKNLMNH